jgi:hypothetical protein
MVTPAGSSVLFSTGPGQPEPSDLRSSSFSCQLPMETAAAEHRAAQPPAAASQQAAAEPPQAATSQPVVAGPPTAALGQVAEPPAATSQTVVAEPPAAASGQVGAKPMAAHSDRCHSRSPPQPRKLACFPMVPEQGQCPHLSTHRAAAHDAGPGLICHQHLLSAGYPTRHTSAITMCGG